MKLGILTRAPIVLMVVIAGASPVVAQEEDLARALGGEEMFSLAVGYEQPLSEAPAVATVITAEDIEAIGALSIGDILTTVTGFHVSKTRVSSDLFSIRSVVSELNPHVLVMVNGVPVGDAVQGGRPLGWSLPVQYISRIEVIRGPGSALYGADAFAGTINIITKDAKEIGGVQVGALAGSFGTFGGWAQFGIVGNKTELALSIEAQTTEGHERGVSFDAQSLNDLLTGTSASLAPGPISAGRTDINARADLKYGEHIRWRAAYQGLHNVGTGIGSSFALDPEGKLDVDLFTTDFTYSAPISRNVELTTTASVFHENFESFFQAFPPGAFGAFPEGVLAAFDFKLTEVRGRTNAIFGGWDRHTINSGVGVTYQTSHGIADRRNFFPAPGGLLVPAPGFLSTDELGVFPNAAPTSRTNVFGFVQDEWRVRPDWTLTAGVRVDHYTDFGTTVNPRASLVWTASPTLSLKWLYGSAFRPPTFLESTEGAGQIAIGNPNLNPEMTDTVEFVIQKDWSSRASTSVNGYVYWTQDLITIAADPLIPIPTFMNSEGTRGYGVEYDMSLRPTDRLSFRGGYAFQTAEFRDTGEPVGFAPRHQLYSEGRWSFAPEWSAVLGLKFVGARKRAPGDPRPKLDGYVWGDIAIHFKPRGIKGAFASLSVDNLFDVDAREPSTNAFLAPDDIPLQGRAFLARVGLRY